MKRRTQRRAVRLLQALLVSLALAVVITPPAGAALMREASVLMAEPAGGSSPPALQTVRRIAAVRLSAPGQTATVTVGLEPALSHCPTVVFVRDILLITNRILC